MKQKWTHNKSVPSLCFTSDRLCLGYMGRRIVLINPPKSVCAGNDTKPSICGGTVVEVNADSKHRFENVAGRLNMLNSLFDRPRTIALNIFALADCNGHVLMPGDFPIRFGSFIEERGADDEGFRAKDLCCDFTDCWAFGNGAYSSGAWSMMSRTPPRPCSGLACCSMTAMRCAICAEDKRDGVMKKPSRSNWARSNNKAGPSLRSG